MGLTERLILVILSGLCSFGCLRYFSASFDPGANEWYSAQLRAAREPRLSKTGSLDQHVYRFTWIPSFHPTVSVRVVRQRGTVRLIAKRLTGAGGYEPGRIGERVHKELEVEHWEALERLVQHAGFWRMPSQEPPKRIEGGAIVVGADGAQWVLEGATVSRYHVVDRSFHDDYPSFERACLCLLLWSGLDLRGDLAGYGAELPSDEQCQ